MPKYVVLLRRKRTVWEHQTVVVTSSTEYYAETDAKGIADSDGWQSTQQMVEDLPSGIFAAVNKEGT